MSTPVDELTAWMREAGAQLLRHALELQAEHGCKGVLPSRCDPLAEKMFAACMDVIRAKAAFSADPLGRGSSSEGVQ